MKCEYCGKNLIIGKSELKSEINSTTVDCVQTLLCTNTECSVYCGNDLSNPLAVSKTITTKVGG